MERIPPEVWETVFGKLLNSRDSQNAYNTCQLWRKVLQPSRSSWMFGLVFPLLEKYLTVNDAIKCRTICKHWLHGVNNYLLNNPHIRPTIDDPVSPEFRYRTDLPLDYYQRTSVILWKLVEVIEDRREDMVKVSTYDQFLPLIGRWFQIYWSSDEPQPQFPAKFLRSFGSHIWFLRIKIREMPNALDLLEFLLSYLPFFSNLKRLNIDFNVSYPPTLPSQQRRQYLKKYLETSQASNQIKKLPKYLETLDMEYWYLEIRDKDQEFKRVLLEMMMSSGENLQSVVLGEMSDLACLETGNIVDLSVTLRTYAAVRQIFNIKSPVRRLKLGCHDDIIPREALFRVAKHFQETLRNFHLDLHYFAFEVDEEKFMNKRCFCVEPLTNRDALLDLKYVKRMTIEGSCFVSLNFLCGLSRSLEYLHFMVHSPSEKEEKAFAPYLQWMDFTEQLDLLKVLRQFEELKEGKVIYDSNVWKVFPKLRELTTELWCPSLEVYRFRRDVYEKQNIN